MLKEGFKHIAAYSCFIASVLQQGFFTNRNLIEHWFSFRTNGLKKQLEILVSHHTGLDKVAASKRLQEYFEQDGRK